MVKVLKCRAKLTAKDLFYIFNKASCVSVRVYVSV